MSTKSKVYFFYSSLPSYMFKCINALATEINNEIIVVETSQNKNNPLLNKNGKFQIISWGNFLRNFNKNSLNDIKIVFISGWGNSKLRFVSKYFSEINVDLVLLSDQSKKNNFRQIIGKLLLKKYLIRFRSIIVPGKSGYELLKYYGVSDDQIKIGLYSSDNLLFNRAWEIRNSFDELPKSFLFDGQIIKRKGIKFLIKEYLEYKRISQNPWDLIIVGRGKLQNILPKEVKYLGYTPFDELVNVYSKAWCFVLPSFEDHWPLVIHQATCAGLPLLLSPFCYNHFEFFRENENGFFVNPHIKGSLTQAMLKIENLNEEKLKEMGKLSFELSKSYSIEKWVELFKDLINN